jgi:ATP-dependent Clp protease ATP-binding subunit ClpC
MNMLLQILDDGRLTDGQGRIIDFRNTIIICTANLGFDFAREGHTLGFATDTAETSYDMLKDKLLGEAKRTFRPELLNRFDEMVVFRKLEKGDMVSILKLELGKLQSRLKDAHVTLTLDKKATEFLVEKGYDSALGARPLRRVVQEYLEDPLADLLLAGKTRPRMRAKLAKDGKSLKF